MGPLGDMYIAEVSRLPWPHGLFRCANAQAFEAAIPEADRDHAEKCQPHVEKVSRSFSETQLRHCPYHRPDWNLAAKAAIDWWRGRRSEDHPSDFARVLVATDLSAETR